MLEERSRTGADIRDEVWEGVLHMVPQPTTKHQAFGARLLVALQPAVRALNLEFFYETSLYRPASALLDYRVPDLMFTKLANVSERGVEGKAEFVIELLSEDDESREKLPFYQEVGVAEVLLVDPGTREFELYSLRGGKLHAVLPDGNGAVRSQTLGVTFAKVAGPRLALTWAGGGSEL